MALEGNGNDMVMPVAPYIGGNNGCGNFGGDWGWIILLLLFAGGGWGNGFGFGGGNELYPWMNQAEVTTNGFQNLSTQNQVSQIQSDLGDIQSQICNGFSQAEIAENSRQMANMQQMFDLSNQLSTCCCENRLATCQTNNTIQSEGAATRFADLNNTRDIMENCNRNNQAILDKLCALELDQKNQKINDLERDLTMANLAASQIQQTATIQAGQVAEVDALYQRLKDCPVGTMPVYGSQPIFTCGGNNTGCGCSGI
jgi:hypothetical protein